jgi:hypothetical protein
MGNGPAKKKDRCTLTEEEISSLAANTSFSREEIIKWHEGFIVSIFSISFLFMRVLKKLQIFRKIVQKADWISENSSMCTKSFIRKAKLINFAIMCSKYSMQMVVVK